MTFLVAEELAREVRARIGAHDDPRLVEVLEAASFTIEHASSSWEASAGTVVAHHVRVSLPAAWLDELGRHPSLEDAVTALVARVFAERPAESLGAVSFELREGGEAPKGRCSPYR